MNYLSYAIFGVLLLTLVLLAVPISLGYDSTAGYFQVNWLGLTLTRRWGREQPAKIRRKTTKRPRNNYARALLAHLWQQGELIAELISQVGRFVLGVVRTLSFRDSVAGFSLPDPMWNGVLYGILSNLHLEEFNLSVNFEQRNYARIRVTFFPYRVARQLAVLLIHLPYLQIIRFARDLKRS